MAGWLAAGYCTQKQSCGVIHNEPHLHYHQHPVHSQTDVGMHGLLASQSCYHILCYKEMFEYIDIDQ